MSEEKITLRKQNDLYVCEFSGKEYGFRKLTWGERSRITSQCTKTSPIGMPTLDMGEFNLNLLMSSLKKAPFDVKREVIDNYPDAILIDKLIQIATKLNVSETLNIQNL